MADKHRPRDNQDRNEPTLGNSDHQKGTRSEPRQQKARETVRDNDSQARPQANDQPTQQLNHERRDERQFVRVSAPFQVQLEDGHTLPGEDISLGGFSVHSDHSFEPDQVVKVSLLLMAGSAELIVPVVAKALRNHKERSGNSRISAFEIVQIDQRHRELLRRIVRAHLSGRYTAVEDLIEQEDPQTPRKRRSVAASTATQEKEKKPLRRYAALIAAAVVLFIVLAATVYRNFMLIEPSFAAVTAPRIDILAPGAGQLSEHSLSAGDRVKRDELLAKVSNSSLETDLILARAAYNYNAQLIENMRESFGDPNVDEVSMARSTTPVDGRPPSFENVSPEIAKIRIQQFETAKGYENARVDALDARLAANSIYSPCDCVVAWALSSAGGTYINESDRIMTLIRTDDDDVMVEALVHMSDIADIQPHQRAYVALPNASEPIVARVRSVALDVERQPRAGFPEWVRQQQNVASVLLVPEEPLSAEAVGLPVDVRFSETPLVDGPVEWVWQGGRAVIQQVQNFFGAIAS
ncbi:alginate biosynthesis protein Alg44 [Halomonas sp. M20]|uniref:alginate biosynthesis protein Alg44 n=1 Tax=Halomonas sp. M20 TaxID=2763264 RepID=UPI001D0B7D08|nr:alginate biosynthesis protein Alg44 [Halomonas sp. M20]